MGKSYQVGIFETGLKYMDIMRIFLEQNCCIVLGGETILTGIF
jgi:hypothetical protein